jgi:hypothetical protein
MAGKDRIKTNVIRLLKWIAIILVILCVIVYFLNQRIKSKYCGFKKLDKDSIEYITLYKYEAIKIENGFSQRNKCKDSLMLSKSQIGTFVRKWNNSYSLGPCKFMPSFTLFAKMKGGSTRDFRIVGSTLKETNDWSYGFIFGNNFFDNIWNKK